MKFTIWDQNIDTSLPNVYWEYKVKSVLKSRLTCSSFKAADKLANIKLKEKYGISLIDLALISIMNIKVIFIQKDHIGIEIKDPTISEAIRYVTFGDGTFFGSKLIVNLFK